jgi:hypothetical protein
MEHQADDQLEVEYERAYVVYDETGAIVHEHRTTTFVGAEGRSEQEDEQRAIEFARQAGHRERDLQALSVDTDFELQPTHRVDASERRLIGDRSAGNS